MKGFQRYTKVTLFFSKDANFDDFLMFGPSVLEFNAET